MKKKSRFDIVLKKQLLSIFFIADHVLLTVPTEAISPPIKVAESIIIYVHTFHYWKKFKLNLNKKLIGIVPIRGGNW